DVKNHRFSLAGGRVAIQSHYRNKPKRPRLTPTEIDPFVEITQLSWEDFVSAGKWTAAAEIGEISARKRPHLYYGWENWAWALHKLGSTQAAYDLLAPHIKGLRPKGPPSGRAAWCLACSCLGLGRTHGARRWLKLAGALARDKSLFHFHTLREPDLQALWRDIE